MLMSPLTQWQASVTGQIENAMLVVHDYRAIVKEFGPNVKETDMLMGVESSRKRATQHAIDNGIVFPEFEESKNKYYHVQFNPSRLAINASILPVAKSDATDPSKSVNVATEDTRLNLTLHLYFDDMRVYDAFIWEKFTAGMTVQGAANLANFIKENLKGRIWTVQNQVEGLLAALRNPYTRNVSFRWADFAFIGQMNTVQSRYTMFSPSGRPIRAQVLLRLHHELDSTMLSLWKRDYDLAFGENVSMLVRPEQGYGSLLSLGL